MVSLAVACLGFVLIGFSPVRIPHDTGDVWTFLAAIAVLGLHVALILLCVAKGKYRTALFGAFLPYVAVFGTIRLARPGSRWALRRYDPHRMSKANARVDRWDRRYGPIGDWLSDFVAGRPSAPDP